MEYMEYMDNKQLANYYAEIFTAIAEGKEIEKQTKAFEYSEWSAWEPFSGNYADIDVAAYDRVRYRVKPEPKLVPFTEVREFFIEAQKHNFWVCYEEKSYSLQYAQICHIDCPNKITYIGVNGMKVRIVDLTNSDHRFCWADTMEPVGQYITE